MPAPPSLPRHRSDAWSGGFVLSSPFPTLSIAAAGGTVVAATERIYRMRPGATRFQMGEPPDGCGDVGAVAVEPRAAGRPARFAVATYDAIHIFDGEGIASVKVPEDHGEVLGLMWAAHLVDGDAPTPCLHVRFADLVLLLVPGVGDPPGTLVPITCPLERVDGMAADGADGVAFTAVDEENWDLDVWAWERATNQWYRRFIEAPPSSSTAHVAVAGLAVAVSFEFGGVWLTRNIKENAFVELEQLRGFPAEEEDSRGGAIAFDGASADAALFVAVEETGQRSAIVRVDAEGRQERIAEVTVEGAEQTPQPLISQMAWDATRRTLWSAAGRAGVMCSTAPGAPVLVGEEGARRAAS